MRYATRGTGASGGGSSSLGSTNTTLTTGEAVLPNDILTIGADDGKAYYALPPGSVFAATRPLSSTAAASNTLLSTVTIAATNPAAGRLAMTKLSTGNIAILTLAPTTSYPTIYLYDNSGALVASPITVENADASGSTLDICALSGGGFVVAYSTGTTTPRHAVYTDAGAVTTAVANVEVAAGIASLCMCPLVAGGYVIGYYKTVAAIHQPYFARFNAAGVLQGAITAIDATATADATRALSNLSLAGLTGGGFVAAYAVRTANENAWFARYDATGTLQGARTQWGANGATGYQRGVCVAGLTDGGFAVIDWTQATNTNNMSRHAKYDAAGAQVSQSGLINYTAGATATIQTYRVGVVQGVAGGGYAYAYENGDASLIAGVVGTTGTAVGSGTLATFRAPLRLALEASGDVLVAGLTGATPGTPNAARITASSGAVAALAPPSGTTAETGILALTNPQNANSPNYVLIFANSLQLKFYNTRIQAMTLAGVATASAVANTGVPAQITGVTTVRLPFAQPYAINAQSNTTPGQKMSVVGNTAILLGIQ